MIKKFNTFSSLNEELFGLTRAEKIDRRIKNLQDSLDKYLPVWSKKGSIKMPNRGQLDKFWDDAKLDDYKSGDVIGGSGGVGIDRDTKSIMYRPSDKIRTKSGLEGATSGISESIDSASKLKYYNLSEIDIVVTNSLNMELKDNNIVIVYKDGTCTYIDNFHGESQDYSSIDDIDSFNMRVYYPSSDQIRKAISDKFPSVDKVYLSDH